MFWGVGCTVGTGATAAGGWVVAEEEGVTAVVVVDWVIMGGG